MTHDDSQNDDQFACIYEEMIVQARISYATKGQVNLLLPALVVGEDMKSNGKIFCNFRWDRGSNVVQMAPQFSIATAEEMLTYLGDRNAAKDHTSDSLPDKPQHPLSIVGLHELTCRVEQGTFQTYNTVTSAKSNYVYVWILQSSMPLSDDQLEALTYYSAQHVLAFPKPLLKFMMDLMLDIIDEETAPAISAHDIVEADSPQMDAELLKLLKGF